MKRDVEAKSHLSGDGENMMVRLIIDADRLTRDKDVAQGNLGNVNSNALAWPARVSTRQQKCGMGPK